MAEDELSLACQKVGLFFHKFALLEQEINERIVDMLELKGDAADVVTHSLDFFKKLNTLWIVAIGRTPSEKKKRVERIFKAIAKRNDNRQIMAHCRFEPVNGSVQFRRTVAKDGKVRVQDKDHLWSSEKFEKAFLELDDLRTKLGELKPQLTFVPGTAYLFLSPQNSDPRSHIFGTLDGNILMVGTTDRGGGRERPIHRKYRSFDGPSFVAFDAPGWGRASFSAHLKPPIRKSWVYADRMTGAVSKSEAAAAIGVSPSRLSHWLSEGKIDGAAVVGSGRGALIDVDLARAQLDARLHLGQRLGANGKARLDGAASAIKSARLASLELANDRARAEALANMGRYIEADKAAGRISSALPTTQSCCAAHVGQSPQLVTFGVDDPFPPTATPARSRMAA